MFVALELKRGPKSKATRLQAHTIELINRAGGFAVVVSPENWNKVIETLKTLAEGGKCDRTNLGAN
jgi:hypothetical protein